MTQEEKQEIINAVLSAIMTNSKTIEQLTPTESLSDNDAIEVSGGRRISYAAFLSAVQVGVQLMLDGYLTGESAVAWFAALENNPANYVGAPNNPVQLHWRQSPIVLLDSMGEDLDGDDDFTAQVGDKWWDPTNSTTKNYIFLKTSTGQDGWPIGSGNVNDVLYVNKRTGRMYLWDGTDMVELVGATGGGGSIIKDVKYENGYLVFTFDTEQGDEVVSVPVDFDASNYVPITRTVNGKALSQNITIGQSDISGLVAALAAKVSGIKVNNGETQTPTNGVVNLEIQGGSSVDVVDNLNSTDGTKALSAKQGKVLDEKIAGKQDTLTFDNAPTANSNNVVRSGGIKQAIDDKLTEVTLTEISGAADIVVIDDADLAFIDQQGNIAMQVAGGHIQTSEFDSAQVKAQVAANTASVASINQQIAGIGGQSDVAVKNDDDAPFDISDAAGNVVLRVNGQGHIQTKGYDSQFAAMTLETPMCICHAVSSPLGDAYNHTMKHFRTAIARGHQFIECDGYNCMDGVPVCAHDSSYSFYVKNSTTGETASKSFPSINSADLIAGYTWTAPTIEDGVITEYGEPIIKVTDLLYFVCYIHRCNLYIDAKGMNTQSVKDVLDYAESIGCRQLVWIEPSNNAINLSGVQCNICAAGVTLQNMATVVTNYKRDGYNLMLQLVKTGATSQMRREFAEAAHSYGCYAYTWSMNSAQETRGWFDDGFDFIFTEGYSTVTWYITKYTVFNLQ